MKNIWLPLTMLAIPLLMAEASAHLYWSLKSGESIFSAPKMIHSFYPNLNFQKPAPNQDTIDVLMLGGSVLQQIQPTLEAKLKSVKRPYRIYNVSIPGHTSMDSVYKYRHLKEQGFDLVVFYHGINEVRANYVPDDEFEDDYSHFYWYSVLSSLNESITSPYLALPFTANFFYQTAKKITATERSHRTEIPRSKYLKYGASIKSAFSLQNNIETLMEETKVHGSQFLLMSFAYSTQFGGFFKYSKERYEAVYQSFNERYDSHGGAEIWGEPEYVVDAIKVHNEVMRLLATTNPGVHFIDQEKLIDKDTMFGDICHLNHRGMDAFVDALIRKMNTMDFPSPES